MSLLNLKQSVTYVRTREWFRLGNPKAAAQVTARSPVPRTEVEKILILEYIGCGNSTAVVLEVICII